MQRWLEDGHAIILSPSDNALFLKPLLLTLSMCSSVVLPALSRPRNSSLACLFIKPSDARTSQTTKGVSGGLLTTLRRLTPVDDPHGGGCGRVSDAVGDSRTEKLIVSKMSCRNGGVLLMTLEFCHGRARTTQTCCRGLSGV